MQENPPLLQLILVFTMKRILLALCLVVGIQSYAQKSRCECGKDLEFLAERYLNDYSGIRDFAMLHPDYATRIDDLVTQATSTQNLKKCGKLIGKLIAYIDNGHVIYGQTAEHPFYGKQRGKDDKGAPDPTLQFIESSTAVLTIKTCNLAYKPDLDSLLTSNEERLRQTEHLIIDLRGNAGGGDAMFDLLVPYLYTGPILLHNAELWSSANNIQLFVDLLENPDVPNDLKPGIERIVSAGRNNPNSFVAMTEHRIDTLMMNEVLDYPKRVSVVIDDNCKSATEQFLLLAKQSAKVTVYGKTASGGALDYSNLNFVVTPSGYWYASVPTTRTTRIPEQPVDPNGIAPDVFIGRDVKDVISWLIEG